MIEHRRPAGARRRARRGRSRARTRRRRRACRRSARRRTCANSRAPLEQQADHLEEVLVPAHRDAVLGDAAEARHHALRRAARAARRCRRIGSNGTRSPSGSTPESAASSGSILRPSMPTTVWPSFIRWCASVKPAGPRPTTSTRLPRRLQRIRPAQVERIPAREQRIDLEAPRQLEHVLQRARLRLRDVDRVLLLVDARLHAVVADAVAGGRRHRVVDAMMPSAPSGRPRALSYVELGDPLFQRAAGERHAEHRLLESRRRRRPAPFRAGPCEHESLPCSWHQMQ